MQMTDLPTSKAQLVLFIMDLWFWITALVPWPQLLIINNFNNCKKLNTSLFFHLCQYLCSTKFISYFELQ